MTLSDDEIKLILKMRASTPGNFTAIDILDGIERHERWKEVYAITVKERDKMMDELIASGELKGLVNYDLSSVMRFFATH